MQAFTQPCRSHTRQFHKCGGRPAVAGGTAHPARRSVARGGRVGPQGRVQLLTDLIPWLFTDLIPWLSPALHGSSICRR